MANVAAQAALHVVVDHLGEAAEFALDGRRLAHQHFLQVGGDGWVWVGMG